MRVFLNDEIHYKQAFFFFVFVFFVSAEQSRPLAKELVMRIFPPPFIVGFFLSFLLNKGCLRYCHYSELMHWKPYFLGLKL